MSPHNDIEELEGPFEQIAGAAAADGSKGSSDSPSLEIYYKNEKVTGKTKDVWVRQLVSLVAKTDPAGPNIENSVWTIADKIVDGYKVDPPEKGVLTPFNIEKLKNSSVWFYWANSGSKEVTFRGTINGVITDVQATFNVKKPEVTVVINDNAAPQLLFDEENENRVILRKRVEWDRRGQTREGEITWVQLGKIDITVLDDTGNFAVPAGMQYSGEGLDGETFRYDGQNSILIDTPNVRTDRRIAFSISITETFHDWIMFKHKEEGSIWVPLKKLDWWWWGNASRFGTSGWTLDSSDYESDPQATDTDMFPVWESNITEPPVLTPIGQ